MELIDKSALVAEIEKCYNECLNRAKIIDSDYWNAKAEAYSNVLVILDDTLEVKDVESKVRKQIMEDAVPAIIDFPLIGFDYPNICPNYMELKEYCIRHGIKDDDKVKITIVKEE